MTASRFVYLVGLMAVTACGSAGAGGGRRDPTLRDPNLLTREEIEAAHDTNLYDVIARLRPNFLRFRGRTTIRAEANDYATVFLDGQRYGDLTSLRSIVIQSVTRVRFLGAGDAVTRYGKQYGGGVIDVSTRP